jgi:homoserine trans-succinylase
MPLILDHPAPAELLRAGISALSSVRARQQDIAPLRVLLLDGDRPLSAEHPSMDAGDFAQALTSLLAQLSNSPLQVELALDWQPGAEVAFDGVIVTAQRPLLSAPPLPAASASLLMGEAARQDLEHRHGIIAEQLTRPLTEIVAHHVTSGSPLMAGQEPLVDVPVVRTWRISASASATQPGLQVLAHSAKAGVHLVYEPAIRRLYVLNSLALTPLEFARQRRQLLPRRIHDQPADEDLPPYTWRTHAYLLIADWLNNDVYQPSSWSRANVEKAAMTRP